MHLVYLDDSRKDKNIQIVCAAIIPDQEFQFVEQHFGHVIEAYVPQEIRERDDFEFHSTDMFNALNAWKGFPRDSALDLMSIGIDSLAAIKSQCITFGLVDLAELSKSPYGGADPVDVAFRLCCCSVESWFLEHAHESMGIFISDEASPSVKKTIRKSFREFRKRVESSPMVRGILDHSVDDIYFGSSVDSIGIQLADICAFVIRRHLAGHESTDFLYQKLKPKIYPGRSGRTEHLGPAIIEP